MHLLTEEDVCDIILQFGAVFKARKLPPASHSRGEK